MCAAIVAKKKKQDAIDKEAIAARHNEPLLAVKVQMEKGLLGSDPASVAPPHIPYLCANAVCCTSL